VVESVFLRLAQRDSSRGASETTYISKWAEHVRKFEIIHGEATRKRICCRSWAGRGNVSRLFLVAEWVLSYKQLGPGCLLGYLFGIKFDRK
jgi:hypothetical protein